MTKSGLKSFLKTLAEGWTWKCTWGFSHKIHPDSEEKLYEPNMSPLFTYCLDCHVRLRLTVDPTDEDHYIIEVPYF